jgi:hypothetical protein
MLSDFCCSMTCLKWLRLLNEPLKKSCVILIMWKHLFGFLLWCFIWVGLAHDCNMFDSYKVAISKVVRIPIQVLESYDFTTLQHPVDPNPTMNPNLVEFKLSPNPNHRILYNIAKSWSFLWTLPILEISWVIVLTVAGYYVNLPSHFHLPHNPLFNKFALMIM